MNDRAKQHPADSGNINNPHIHLNRVQQFQQQIEDS